MQEYRNDETKIVLLVDGDNYYLSHITQKMPIAIFKKMKEEEDKVYFFYELQTELKENLKVKELVDGVNFLMDTLFQDKTVVFGEPHRDAYLVGLLKAGYKSRKGYLTKHILVNDVKHKKEL